MKDFKKVKGKTKEPKIFRGAKHGEKRQKKRIKNIINNIRRNVCDATLVKTHDHLNYKRRMKK